VTSDESFVAKFTELPIAETTRSAVAAVTESPKKTPEAPVKPPENGGSNMNLVIISVLLIAAAAAILIIFLVRRGRGDDFRPMPDRATLENSDSIGPGRKYMGESEETIGPGRKFLVEVSKTPRRPDDRRMR
jgi:hypothetical protein